MEKNVAVVGQAAAAGEHGRVSALRGTLARDIELLMFQACLPPVVRSRILDQVQAALQDPCIVSHVGAFPGRAADVTLAPQETIEEGVERYMTLPLGEWPRGLIVRLQGRKSRPFMTQQEHLREIIQAWLEEHRDR